MGATRGPNSGVGDLYRQHGNWLFDFLRRRFGREEAEELVQETYVRVLGRQVEIRNPRAFLARVAINAAQNRAEARAVRPQLIFDEAATMGVAEAADQEHLLLLKQTILALPPKLQEVFLLSRFKGMTYEEIAVRCGISVKAVEWRMAKTLAMLTALLD